MKKLLICFGLLLLAAACTLRLGYRIELNGEPVPGVYSVASALECTRAVQQAAEEICRGAAEPPFQLIPVICLDYAELDRRELCRTLLSGYEGVTARYESLENAPAVQRLFTYAP